MLLYVLHNESLSLCGPEFEWTNKKFSRENFFKQINHLITEVWNKENTQKLVQAWCYFKGIILVKNSRCHSSSSAMKCKAIFWSDAGL